jgi:hypothetical protein
MQMNTWKSLWVCFFTCVVFAAGAAAQELYVYPKAGQSQEQMEKDKYDCYQWAKGQTGFDPMVEPTASSPPPQTEAPQGGVARGAARGAVVGLAAGSIVGKAGKGAAIGAASGGLIGGIRRRDQVVAQQQAEEQWVQQEAAAYQQARSEYNRAYKACLEGRDYKVN